MMIHSYHTLITFLWASLSVALTLPSALLIVVAIAPLRVRIYPDQAMHISIGSYRHFLTLPLLLMRRLTMITSFKPLAVPSR